MEAPSNTMRTKNGLTKGQSIGQKLTAKQWVVAGLTASPTGLTYPELAARLGVKPGTAKRHVADICLKLNLHSAHELSMWYLEKKAEHENREMLERLAMLESQLEAVTKQRDTWRSWFAL